MITSKDRIHGLVAGVAAAIGTLMFEVPCAWAQALPSGAEVFWGRRYQAPPRDEGGLAGVRHPPPVGLDTRARIIHWNEVLLNANALDHTLVEPGEERTFGEQLGPGRTARAFAIVHIAVFDAINAVVGGYRSYTNLPPAANDTSIDAAIAQAAHDTLLAMYASQSSAFDELLTLDLAQIPDGPAKDNGIALGQAAAVKVLAKRAHDGSDHAEPVVGVDYFPNALPGYWRPDPVSMIPVALGVYWGEVKPFAMPAVSLFPAPAPPALDSAEYAAAFNEVQALGGDGVITPTIRTDDQTIAGIYWGYDGTPGLGTPPRLYNQITVQIAEQMNSDAVDLARLLALVNVAMADGGVASWESKYAYEFWRPIAGIREADEGTGPSGQGDGNPLTTGDVNFTPLGAPASNLLGPNFTPPFPAYTSGHATFGGAVFQTLRRFYGTDDIAFTFVSDEFNGVTLDNQGNARPLIPRSFSSLSQAEEENGQSRIYLGIHWAFDKTEGIAQGRRIADYVFARKFAPLDDGHGVHH